MKYDVEVKKYLADIHSKKCDILKYKEFCHPERIDHILSRSKELKGFKWTSVNTSCLGGGVAVTLSAAIPFYRALGIDAQWNVLNGDSEFFLTTKRMHDALQGIPTSFSTEELTHYEEIVKNFSLTVRDSDIIEVNDFQLIPFAYFSKHDGKSMFWRSHLDTSFPVNSLVNYYDSFLNYYGAYLFTHPDYIFKKSNKINSFQVLPTLDPLDDKNKVFTKSEALEILKNHDIHINCDKIIVSSCARFDIHKNQLELVKIIKENLHNFPREIVFVVMGSTNTMDSPDEYDIFPKVKEECKGCAEIILLPNMPDEVVGSILELSDIFLHLATKEGFGMVITEAMWHKTPVIAYKTPGVSLQVKNNHNGFIVNDKVELISKINFLIKDPLLLDNMKVLSNKFVKDNFLIDNFILRHIEFMRLIKGLDNNSEDYKLC